jgi:hypothetical protein
MQPFTILLLIVALLATPLSAQAQDLSSYKLGTNLNEVNDDDVTTLFTSANRDSRMGTLYTSYLGGWKARNGGLFMNFSDISTYSRFVAKV